MPQKSSLLSILIPVFNEEDFLGELLARVLSARLPSGLDSEVIIVDDGSTDASGAIAQEWAAKWPGRIRYFSFGKNRGKGAAIRQAITEARGEFCLVQDADLEYSPSEYRLLLDPLIDGSADVVYGSRFASSGRRRVLYYWHSLANHFLTTVCNVVSDLNLTDIETGYKAFRSSLLQSIPIRSDRFGFEPEITIKCAKRQARFYEVPISYEGRTYAEGKKIRARDALEALGVILRFAFTSDLYVDEGAEILDAFSVAPRFNAWMAQTIRPFVGNRVLEIGAGMGNLTAQLSPGKLRYYATDVDEEHLGRLRNRTRHRVNVQAAACDLRVASDFDAFRGEVDTVICLNVLEHMADDRACLRNMYDVLPAGGCALILVPHGQEIYGALDRVLGHHRRYSHEELRGRLQQAGFHVRDILDFNRISRPGWFIKGKILKHTRISRIQLKLFDRMVWLWSRMDPRIPWNPTSIIAIADKPGSTQLPELVTGVADRRV
jgi:glycosyltransferase involved in cell wall biosynthesis/predicted RNA methylase